MPLCYFVVFSVPRVRPHLSGAVKKFHIFTEFCRFEILARPGGPDRGWPF
jgi:hypothetical protein